jgi:hypothetical protein
VCGQYPTRIEAIVVKKAKATLTLFGIGVLLLLVSTVIVLQMTSGYLTGS